MVPLVGHPSNRIAVHDETHKTAHEATKPNTALKIKPNAHETFLDARSGVNEQHNTASHFQDLKHFSEHCGVKQARTGTKEYLDKNKSNSVNVQAGVAGLPLQREWVHRAWRHRDDVLATSGVVPDFVSTGLH